MPKVRELFQPVGTHQLNDPLRTIYYLNDQHEYGHVQAHPVRIFQQAHPHCGAITGWEISGAGTWEGDCCRQDYRSRSLCWTER